MATLPPSTDPPIRLLRSAAAVLLVLDLAVTLALLWPGLLPEPVRPLAQLAQLAMTVSLAGLLLLLLHRLVQALRERQAEQQNLQALFDASPTGLVLWGPDGRLQRWNADFARLYAPLADLLQPGATFETLMRAAVTRGLVPEALGHEDAWLAQRFELRRQPGQPVVRQQADGRWRRIVEQRLPDGSVLGHSVDVTEVVQQGQALEALNRQLDEANAELRRQADTDALTGIANRRRFDRELDAAVAAGAPLALLVLDIDHFKRFNDHHGHPAGDACLRRVAGLLTAVGRGPGDLCARIGGEEFAMLLPGADTVGGIAAAQRSLDLLAGASISHGDSPLGPVVTLSVGIAVHTGGAIPALELLARADDALYEAKHRGRARWHLAPGTQAQRTVAASPASSA